MSKDDNGQGKPRKEGNGNEQMKKIFKGAIAGASFASLTRNPLVIVMGAVAGGAAAAFKDEFRKALKDAGHVVEYGKDAIPGAREPRTIPVKGAGRKPGTDGAVGNPFKGLDTTRKRRGADDAGLEP